MSQTIEVRVPDLGNFGEVSVIEVLVKVGDTVEVETPLITLETEKATMDVPSSAAGVVEAVHVKAGGKVSEGALVVTLRGAAAAVAASAPAPATAASAAAPAVAAVAAVPGKLDVLVPDMGNFTEVGVIEVLVKPGDKVEVDTPLVTLETEKATMDVPSTAAGTVEAVHVQAGGKISAGGRVVTLSGVIAAVPAAAPMPATAAQSPAQAAASKPVAAAPASRPASLPPVSEAGFSKAHAGPSVRKLARELGVDLGRVKGSGQRGRITHDDVKAWVKQILSGGGVASGPALPQVPVVDFAKFGEIEIKPLGRIQKISGSRLHASWVNLVHVTQFDEADITALEAERAKLKDRAAAAGVKLTPLAFVVRAAVLALREFPTFNSSFDASGENVVLKKYINIGFAADTPNGLLVPVIQNADKLDVYGIARALADMSDRARKGTLKGNEMQGGCFTITSLGGIGGTAFTPIINAPEVAILGVSRTQTKPVWQTDKFVPRQMLPLSLSYDHRMIDGALGARFAVHVSKLLADPAVLLAGADLSDVQVAVPDLGNFDEVAVVEVLVKPGDKVEVDTPLVTLETEKATMDVPSTAAGTITAVQVKAGDKVRKGSVIVHVAASASAPAAVAAPKTMSAAPAPANVPPASQPAAIAAPATPAATHAPAPVEQPLMPAGPTPDRKVQLVVLGGGPGGYTAAFRAADLGLQVLVVERWETLGGVCLNVGCIPSKALLHAAKVIDEAKSMGGHGVTFGAPEIDLDKLRDWKNSVIRKLTGGLTGLAKTRKVEVVRGIGKFAGSRVIEVTGIDGKRQLIGFDNCIIAAGSEPVKLPFIPEDPRIIDSTGALELGGVPKRLLVIGGGIIGLEMACVYEALGAKVSVVELGTQLMPGADVDLVKPLEKRLKARYEQIMLGTKSTKVEVIPEGIRVTFDAGGQISTQVYDRVLVAVGRVPNGKLINAEVAGVMVNERGFVPVDKQMRTNVPGIFAIGDIVGQPMLAHKATHEAKVAAEVAAGHKAFFDARVIPSVAYTDPEVAWVGVTEGQAKQSGLNFRKAAFPWAASGRSLSLGRDEGFTKLLVDAETNRIIGGGIVGPNAGELIAEVGLAIELGADTADVGLTIHPHPTLSESVGMTAEALEGTLTDLYMPKK